MNEIEIIAEIGVNHNGDVNTARKLIDAAAKAGADTAKFQLWDTQQVYPRERWNQMKRLEISRRDLAELHAHCNNVGIRFLCTPDAWEDARYLALCGVDRLKIGSSNLTNINMLRMLPQLGLPVILSTGASSMSEISAAVYALKPLPLTILHCLSAYPAPPNQLNLLVIQELIHSFRLPVGFSDHTEWGATAALVALGLGARTFEKHFTLDTDQAGPDHKMSLGPWRMQTYVKHLRDAALMLGTGVKEIMSSEKENRVEYERFVAQQAKNGG